MFNNMENRDLNIDNEKNEEDKKRRGIWLILLYIIIILMLMIAVVITSANFLNATINGNEMIITPEKIIDGDDDSKDNTNGIPKSEPVLRVLFEQQKDTKIRMLYAYPVSEAKALESSENMIKFKVKNERSRARYKITLRDFVNTELEEKYSNRIDHKYLNYYLKNENNGQIYKGKLSDLDLLDSNICSGIINQNETINYSLAVWLDESASNDVQDSYYSGKLYITVEGD